MTRHRMLARVGAAWGLLLVTGVGWSPAAGKNADAAAQEAPGPAAEELRDPFVPVNFTPQPAAAVAKAQGGATVPQKPRRFAELSTAERARVRAGLRIGGILRRGSNYVALVNGELVHKGDRLTASYEGAIFAFQVTDISEKNLLMEPADQKADLAPTGER